MTSMATFMKSTITFTKKHDHINGEEHDHIHDEEHDHMHDEEHDHNLDDGSHNLIGAPRNTTSMFLTLQDGR